MNLVIDLFCLALGLFCCWYLMRRVNDWRGNSMELMRRGYTFRFRHVRVRDEKVYVVEIAGDSGSVSVYDVDLGAAVWRAINQVRSEE